MSIWVCGEVLIDILPTGPVVGGGPANTAKALARLGHDVDFIDGISTDAYGVSARKELERDGVGLSLSLTSAKPTCTATVALDSAGSAALWGTALWDIDTWGAANQGAVVLAGSNLGLARSVQLKISGPASLSWGVDSFTIKYNPRKVKA